MDSDYLCIPLLGCLSVLEQFYIGIALVFLGGAVVGGTAVWLARKLHDSGEADRIARNQSGNVFFTLFGAVAIVGAIGASTMQIANGPVRTMAEVTKRTVAENNMIAGARLAIITSTTLQADSGDCDADGFVEPFPSRNPGGAAAPSGGGLLPGEIAIAKLDPWQNEYGYCVWDHGALSVSDDVAGCGGSAARRLEGGNLNTQYALVLISSGPDRVFQTSCNDWVDVAPADGEPDVPLLNKVSGSDDIVLGHTYAEASALGAGLWTLKEGSPDTAAIEKDLEVTGGMELSGSLNLLSQGLILPGDPGDDSITGACSPTNDQQLRRNTSTSPPTMEICDDGGSGEWEPIGAGGESLWTDSEDGYIEYDDLLGGTRMASVAGLAPPLTASSLWTLHANGDDLYYNDGYIGVGTPDPQATLDVVGVSSVSDGIFEYWFDNTNDGDAQIDTAWRLRHNDSTGNFLIYINSNGGGSPVYETDGTAYREYFNPGQDTYHIQGAADGIAGDPITWQDILALDLTDGLVGIGTTGPNASAILDLTSTDRGFLPPRMTTAQRNAIASPADGLVIYNSSTDKLSVREDGAWVELSSGGLPTCPDGESLVASGGSWVCSSAVCSGTEAAGGCWFAGNPGQSCTSVCSSHGGYEDLTRTYAGSDGSNGNCIALLDALGAAMGGSFQSATDTGLGCFFRGTDRYRSSNFTTEGASKVDRSRVCACSY